jgi:hypothetical protein
MALERNPNDPYRDTLSNEQARRRAETLENERQDYELQADPELAEGPASGGRLALFAIAIVAILGVVFYGLNNGSMNPNEPTSTAQQTAPANPGQTSPPAGQTTGSAPPPSANTGAPSKGAPAKQ